MALRHGMLEALIGYGLAKVAPDLGTDMKATLRPVAKELIRKGLALADSVQEFVAEGKEHLSDLIAEVAYERSQENAEAKDEKAKAA